MWKYLWNKNIFIAIIFLLLILSLLGNIFLLAKINKIQQAKFPPPETFPLVNPVFNKIPLDSNIQSGKAILHFNELREKIEEKLAGLTEKERIGIYLQDVTTGSWLGINEKEGFIPASLLKVPIVIAIFKKIEMGELKLEQKVEIIAEDIDPSAGVPERFKVGDKKSIAELSKLMLKISDNTAKNVLKRQLSPEDINSVFTHVGIDNPYSKETGDQLVTPRGFSRILKALYFSTYLQPKHSEKILELITETRQEGLIASSIPWEIQVAHKYGERLSLLHDCGIIYHPNNPYFLCIMTSDIPLPDARELIKDISGEVYKFVSEQSK